MGQEKIAPRLINLTDKSSFILEQYRSIRAKILLAAEETSKRTILFTSAVPGEGKTLTSVNIAMTIAQGVEEKVLLIDGDLRNPMVHKLFGIIPEKGLSDYLRGEIDYESIVLDTPIDKLKLIPAGSLISNPSELLKSEKMSALIYELKTRYPDRFIIFDSPPIIPTSDPIILSCLLDWTILVVLAGKTPRETVSRALGTYEFRNILGIILNKVDVLPPEYAYGYNKYKPSSSS